MLITQVDLHPLGRQQFRGFKVITFWNIAFLCGGTLIYVTIHKHSFFTFIFTTQVLISCYLIISPRIFCLLYEVEDHIKESEKNDPVKRRIQALEEKFKNKIKRFNRFDLLFLSMTVI